MSGIQAIWETPTTDDTEFFRVGGNRYHYEHPKNWKIGVIVGPTLEGGVFGYRVFDCDGRPRIFMPATACAVEYEP